MAAYEGFAGVYDLFMDNVDYDMWADYLIRMLQKYEVNDGLVLELGCGTGSLTERLARAGYDMIAIDNSYEMLEVAMEKREESGLDILYLNQDAREFELYGTVAAIVTGCDCMNYITEEEDLLEVFRLANNYLDPGGIFLFDINTAEKYRAIGDKTIAENREEGSFIWENTYDEEEQINEYAVTLFLPEENGLYRKEEEFHYQRAYDLAKVKELLAEAGMEFVAAYEAFTDEVPGKRCERMYIAAREKGKSWDDIETYKEQWAAMDLSIEE
ncbi:MAG: class I SAM-dependent methyltransferase [Lachnospiraceae bacterium]|nr:class I SAM-dependent methyltransferase [Lachnospiraceae bacterium]